MPSSAEALAEPSERDIDLVHLARQTGGDEALEREVLGLFRDQCARLVAAMTRDGFGQPSRDAAHTLAGASKAVGAFRVAALAERVERAAEPDYAAALTALTLAAAAAQGLADRLAACA
jgi:HPt (histidine-containing phosphotransfer) domain-containing protein